MTWSDWIRGAEVEPSIYAANFSKLGEQMRALLDAGCRVFHFDVGDGHFVEPITMGPIVLKDLAPLVHDRGGAIDVHLMVEDPQKYFAPFAEAGGDSVTFHFEAVDDVAATLRAAHDHGLQAGVSFVPETSPDDVAAVAGDADIILCMSIHPGYSGQAFQEAAYGRVARLRELLPDRVHIQVDGGVGPANIGRLHENGATLFVGGAFVFGNADPPAAYRELAQLVT
jgi:ribulose-phosphate 3-epimerase